MFYGNLNTVMCLKEDVGFCVKLLCAGYITSAAEAAADAVLLRSALAFLPEHSGIWLISWSQWTLVPTDYVKLGIAVV